MAMRPASTAVYGWGSFDEVEAKFAPGTFNSVEALFVGSTADAAEARMAAVERLASMTGTIRAAAMMRPRET